MSPFTASVVELRFFEFAHDASCRCIVVMVHWIYSAVLYINTNIHTCRQTYISSVVGLAQFSPMGSDMPICTPK